VPITEGELRAGLPSRSAVEKLVSRYFNSLDPSVSILHYPTFHKQLNKHFQDPTTTCIVWLGLLYSILCLAMQSYNKIGDEPPEWKGKFPFPCELVILVSLQLSRAIILLVRMRPEANTNPRTNLGLSK
jgi:hypothetical protein